MKKFLVMACIIFCIVMLYGSVSADDDNVAISVFSDENGYDDIVVTVNNEKEEGWVSAYIFNLNEDLVFLRQERTKYQNIIVFQLTPDDVKEDTYKAMVTVSSDNGATKKFTKEFSYYTYEQQQDAIREILQADTGSAAGKILEFARVLSLPVSGLYSKINNKSLIIQKMKEVLGPLPGIKTEDFLREFEYCTFMAALNSKDNALIEYMINTYAWDLGINTTEEYKWYGLLESNAAILNYLAKKEYDNKNEFSQEFRNANFLYKLSKTHYLNIEQLLRASSGRYTENGEIFELNFNTYDSKVNTAVKREYAAGQLAGTFFESLASLKSKFNSVINDAASYTPAADDGGGSKNKGSDISRVGIVEATPAQNPPSSQKPSQTAFSDIENVLWAKEAIESFAAEGIVEGVDKNRFDPNAFVTREQFVKMIIRAFEIQGDIKDHSFSDVDKSDWYFEYVNCAAGLGIVQGYNGRFGVGDNITRQDMAVIMYRVAKMKNIALVQKSARKIADLAFLADYAVEAVDTLYKAEIINGTGDGMFEPGAFATRAQAVKLIYDLRRAS